jgi:hypothetical protein
MKLDLDFNFYPEHHMDELMPGLDAPSHWTVGELVRNLWDAKVMLWSLLVHVDDDGNVRWW